MIEQTLAVELCVSNPNDEALNFRSVTAGVEVSHTPLAEGISEAAVLLPAHSSTVVPFEVTTTLRNLEPQLLGVLQTGGVDYRIHGRVELTGSLGITVPYSHRGRLDLMSAVQNALIDPVTSQQTQCGSESS